MHHFTGLLPLAFLAASASAVVVRPTGYVAQPHVTPTPHIYEGVGKRYVVIGTPTATTPDSLLFANGTPWPTPNLPPMGHGPVKNGGPPANPDNAYHGPEEPYYDGRTGMARRAKEFGFSPWGNTHPDHLSRRGEAGGNTVHTPVHTPVATPVLNADGISVNLGPAVIPPGLPVEEYRMIHDPIVARRSSFFARRNNDPAPRIETPHLDSGANVHGDLARRAESGPRIETPHLDSGANVHGDLARRADPAPRIEMPDLGDATPRGDLVRRAVSDERLSESERQQEGGDEQHSDSPRIEMPDLGDATPRGNLARRIVANGMQLADKEGTYIPTGLVRRDVKDDVDYSDSEPTVGDITQEEARQELEELNP
ncbi:uncharacterized protein K452DRAFT_303509 [Aplosporella prunicola CBS 121167]|uniref:Uncharacterized protein n=1 Tax=Aplosporella prunicola CBS 121167 TaxID=1176127 RepID=A0A6A6AUZ5_9PEZI|nr:uncharacterized protein K452DRAFT_303509 [Aplosporella prunicola CBS 121167]KAF2135490.1 hypothetical protein K452DRAFT_303509 [Aplosporella prunicola CBS 121167]